MSAKPVTYYVYACDFPGCEATAQDGAEVSAWGNESSAAHDAENAGWWVNDDKGLAYCLIHPAAWASDLLETPQVDLTFPMVLLNDVSPVGMNDGPIVLYGLHHLNDVLRYLATL